MTLRVLHCIYDDVANPWVAGGGAVRLRELYRRLQDRVRVTVATGNYPGARDESIGMAEYRRMGRERPYWLSRFTFAAAANLYLRRAPYDAAVFDYSAYTPILVPRDRPVGITVHHLTGGSARERWGRAGGALLQAVEGRMIRRARVLSATSRATEAELRRIAPAGVPLRLVQAGVPDELFELERHEEGYLLYFGRLDWIQKGLDVLLEAFARLAPSHPGLDLRIAGRGKDGDRVREYAAELRLGDRVRLLGPVDERRKAELFAGATVALMPSRFEGFGMVAAELMAAGVPLVAAAAGSLPEVVAAPEGGRLVPVGAAAALAEAVEGLLASPAERARLSASARESAERFRWDRVAADHLSFLNEIAASGGTSAS